MSQQIDQLLDRIKEASEVTINGKSYSKEDFTKWIQTPFRPNPFTPIQPEFIERWMFNLSENHIKLYLLLCKYASNQEGISWWSVSRLAEKLNITERSISRITGKLQTLGLIDKGCYRLSGKRHNIYRIALLQTPEEQAPTDGLSSSV